ncbi:MAG TPA: hypothetical protein VFV67_06200 [Actinophytocola sp.]|uniref:3-hydroxyacyl-ACP dehydratase FabZ family protein n=1 Tax=Actinophytocola sp. TaxID=1872138 RepID=UPI002DBAA895|nr:hypothetical protein [Actinophytocola sp.]HEU5470225.1 hypothetical protein [Actinophytocola sp.]
MTGVTERACGPWVAATGGWDVARAGDTVTAVLPVRPTEPVFTGHYPGFPVFPGVCVIECVHRTALAAPPGRIEPALVAVRQARFLAPVRPGDELTITLAWSPAGEEWCCAAEVATARGVVARMRLTYRETGEPAPPAAEPERPVGGPAFGLDGIARLLPHRYPMLLLDRVTGLVPGVRLTATKAVSGNEPWYAGGGPGFAYPPVLVVESWCQAAGVLTGWDDPARVLLLGSMTGVHLAGPVLPGDVVEHRVRMVTAAGGAAVFTGESIVAGRTVLSVRRLVVSMRDEGGETP